jgi:hypothetical protein
MKNFKWMVVVSLASAGVGLAGGVFAAKSKEIVVTPAADVKFQPLDPADKEGKGPQIAVVFGDIKKKGTPLGFLFKAPANFKPGPHSHTSDDYAVIVKGTLHNFAPGDEGKGLTPGGTWYQPGKVVHDNHCEAGSECVAFVYTPNGFDFIPAKVEGAKAETKGDAKPAAKADAPKAEPTKVEAAKK